MKNTERPNDPTVSEVWPGGERQARAFLGKDFVESPGVIGVCGGCPQIVYQTDGHYICDHCLTPFHNECFPQHPERA